MPTTKDVLDQHLKSFNENDLDSLLADYSSDVPSRFVTADLQAVQERVSWLSMH
jgi:hypothetical protein